MNRTPEQLAAIAEYNRGITRSRNQYEAMPTATDVARFSLPKCLTCQQRLNTRYALCAACRRKAKTEVMPDDS
jgi:hypothetical protein